MKKVIITRENYTSNQTTGILKVVNENNVCVMSCMTLELPWKDNWTAVSSIPKGTYEVVEFQSKKFGVCYEVLNVPKRSAILIHFGNYYTDTRGCILVGSALTKLDKNDDLDIIQSVSTMNTLRAICGKKFQLQIE